MSVSDKLMKLEQSLPPQEAVIHWMKHSQGFGSLLTYHCWLKDQPEEIWPLAKILRQAEVAARRRAKGNRPEQVKTGVRAAEQTVVFLGALVLVANVEVTRLEEQIRFQVRQLLGEIKVLLYDRSGYERHLRESLLSERPPKMAPERETESRLATRRSRIAKDIREVRANILILEAAGELLARRYFKGESPLFPDLRDKLGLLGDVISRLENAWETAQEQVGSKVPLSSRLLSEALGKRPPKAKTIAPPSAEASPDTGVQAQAELTADGLLLLAKAQALKVLGEPRQASVLFGRYLQRAVHEETGQPGNRGVYGPPTRGSSSSPPRSRTSPSSGKAEMSQTKPNATIPTKAREMSEPWPAKK